MPFVALLDANVLFSAPVRDLLLRAAERSLYQPIWTERILDEMSRALREERLDIPPAAADYLVGEIRRAFPEALVEGYEQLVPAMTNSEEDRHVLAAAARGGAQVIVTWNISDFPESSRESYGIDLQSPDEFACHTWSLAPRVVADILKEQALALKDPPVRLGELLEILDRQLPKFVKMAVESGLV